MAQVSTSYRITLNFLCLNLASLLIGIGDIMRMATNFRLEEDCPTTLITKDIYSDEELNQVHYLGGYSELVPLNQKFGVVFNVAAFEQGEERILYYYYPDGSKHEVGRLIFDVLNNKEDQGIFI